MKIGILLRFLQRGCNSYLIVIFPELMITFVEHLIQRADKRPDILIFRA